MSKQTAIQWLASQLGTHIIWEETIIDIIEQAKAMEKEQMLDFADNCQEMFLHQIVEKYNETYGGEE